MAIRSAVFRTMPSQHFVLCLFVCLFGGYGLPCISYGKESACNTGDMGSIPGSGRSSGEGNGNPLQYSCLENLMSLVGYSPWGCKELDMAERLTPPPWWMFFFPIFTVSFFWTFKNQGGCGLNYTGLPWLIPSLPSLHEGLLFIDSYCPWSSFRPKLELGIQGLDFSLTQFPVFWKKLLFPVLIVILLLLRLKWCEGKFSCSLQMPT